MKTNIVLLMLFFLLANTNSLFGQWVRTNGPLGGNVYALAISGTDYFAGSPFGVFHSSDIGMNWTRTSGGVINAYVQSLAVSGSELFAATMGLGVFLTTNNGGTWTEVNNGLTYRIVMALALSDTNLFVGTFWGGVYLSTDNGLNWSTINTSWTPDYIYALAVSDTNLFIGTSNGIIRCTYNGTSWIDAGTSLLSHDIRSLVLSGTSLFAGTWSYGLFISTNNGASWSASNLPSTRILALAVGREIIYAGTGDGVFASTNNGTSWIAASAGLTNTPVHCIAVTDTNLFAGNDDAVFRRPISEITSIGESVSHLPSQFSLNQNYPNPFNPSTTISFTLPSKSFVSLRVFDIMGSKVATVVSEELNAGAYSREWNAAGFSSGVYFCRLESGSFAQTRKLLLLK